MSKKSLPLSCAGPLLILGGSGCTVLFILLLVAVSIFTTFFGGGQVEEGIGEGLIAGTNAKEQEVLLTHYYPCTPDFIKVKPDCDPSMEGDESTAIGGKAVYDPSSPMGFYVILDKKRYYYQFASKQGAPEMIPLLRKPEKGVYFDDPKKIFVTLDHYGSCMTHPNGMDIMATDEAYSKFFNNLEKAGLIIKKGVNNGCGKATLVKGNLVDIVEAGITGEVTEK